jgi:hypothetical protein
MYLIKDKQKCKSLTEYAKDIKCTITTSMIELEKEKNDFKDVLENIPVEEIINYKSSSIIYSRTETTNINDILKKVIEHYNIVPKNIISRNRSSIASFEFTINKNKYKVFNDPNDLSFVNWKRVKDICDKNTIEFTNQTFNSVMTLIRNRIIDEKHHRKKFSNEERLNILNIKGHVCNTCKSKVIDCKFDLDHIIPLAKNGTNDISNLQILCKQCHLQKTRNEVEDGSFCKIIDTESSFNSLVRDVMNSELNLSYAFIEKMKEFATINNGIKLQKMEFKNLIYFIDINKCRKNILYYCQYDYCVFTVMDKIEVYDGQMHCFI